ncbi:unnamed protein product [Prunus armeniaca]|uniref:Uncharacterized protein n=1 Tax=Prunus armeniaca TaxID=36596 RepID=A0A6J5TU65_PRUAR|nr:unnamed protein product [Prunus armeniaca]
MARDKNIGPMVLLLVFGMISHPSSTIVPILLLISYHLVRTERSSILLGINPSTAKICPQYCTDQAGYMTCPSSGNTQLLPSCNCCLAPAGCTIYRADGTSVCTGT